MHFVLHRGFPGFHFRYFHLLIHRQSLRAPLLLTTRGPVDNLRQSVISHMFLCSLGSERTVLIEKRGDVNEAPKRPCEQADKRQPGCTTQSVISFTAPCRSDHPTSCAA